MEALEIILLSIGGTSMLLIAAGFLSKKILSHFLAKDIEDYKSSIKQVNEKRLAELKTELDFKSKNKERYLQKLEELHQLLTEMYLRIYVKYFNVCNMIGDECSVEQIRQYLAFHDLNLQEAYVLQSRVKSLSLIYAKNIKSDVGDKIEKLIETIDEFAIKHLNGENTPQDLDRLKEKLESFRLAANCYMEEICKEIQSRT